MAPRPVQYRGAMIYLSLGSNLGDREANLNAALAALSTGGFELRKLSSIYETSPQDVTDQPWFLNLCAAGMTPLAPQDLLRITRDVESTLGRNRDGAALRGGPRLIDIDILFYGEEVIATPDLVIPHPRLLSRRFVLEPLLEIAPDLVHPETHRPLRDYLAAVLPQETRRHPSAS